MRMREINKIFSALWINNRCDATVMGMESCGFNVSMSVKEHEEVAAICGKLSLLDSEKQLWRYHDFEQPKKAED